MGGISLFPLIPEGMRSYIIVHMVHRHLWANGDPAQAVCLPLVQLSHRELTNGVQDERFNCPSPPPPPHHRLSMLWGAKSHTLLLAAGIIQQTSHGLCGATLHYLFWIRAVQSAMLQISTLDCVMGGAGGGITADPLRKSTVSGYAVLKPNFPPENTSLLIRWLKSCLFVIH